MRDRTKGQGLVEYALILVLIAIVVMGMLSIVGGNGNRNMCKQGYFYDYGKSACIPGYRPGEGWQPE